MRDAREVAHAVTINLTADEALVLFEFLARWNDSEPKDQLTIADPAERRVLWQLHGILESTLADPFRADYMDLVDGARAAVRANDED